MGSKVEFMRHRIAHLMDRLPWTCGMALTAWGMFGGWPGGIVSTRQCRKDAERIGSCRCRKYINASHPTERER